MMTAEKMLSFAAVDKDGTETIFDAYPFRVANKLWGSRGNNLQLETGHLASIGVHMTWEDEPRMFPSKMLPVIQITSCTLASFKVNR